MTSWSSSSPLIKGIDGIESRPPNKVNYSTLDRKKMKSEGKKVKEKQRNYREHKITGKIIIEEQKEKNNGNNTILNQPNDANQDKMIENNVEYVGEDDGAIQTAQRFVA